MSIKKLKKILEKDWLDDVLEKISNANENGKKNILYPELTVKQMQVLDKRGFKVNLRYDGKTSISW